VSAVLTVPIVATAIAARAAIFVAIAYTAVIVRIVTATHIATIAKTSVIADHVIALPIVKIVTPADIAMLVSPARAVSTVKNVIGVCSVMTVSI
jgi:hypothetical protein